MPMTGQPVFMRQVHDLDDLLAEHLAQRAAEDGEVLGEHAHRAAVDRAVAGDDAVAVGPVVLHAEAVRRGAGRARPVSTNEPSSSSASIRSRAVILPLACCFSTARGRAGVHRLVVAPVQVGEPARGGVDVDVVGDLGATGPGGLGCAADPGSAASEAVRTPRPRRPAGPGSAREECGLASSTGTVPTRTRPFESRLAAAACQVAALVPRGAATDAERGRVPHDPAGLARCRERAGPGAVLSSPPSARRRSRSTSAGWTAGSRARVRSVALPGRRCAGPRWSRRSRWPSASRCRTSTR